MCKGPQTLQIFVPRNYLQKSCRENYFKKNSLKNKGGRHICRSKLPLRWVAVSCSVLQCVAVCCSVLQCVAVCCSVLWCVAVRHSLL